MKNKDREVLKQFQTELTRSSEEGYARIFTENEMVRLFFINEDRAFTDGRNIVVDPASHGTFCDRNALYYTEKYMNLPHKVSADPWTALYMITRAQTIHECLHILYTRFPIYAANDERSTNKFRRSVLAMIGNIIEDAYIEAVGCSEYDNLEFFLLFGRLAQAMTSSCHEGTVQQIFGKYEDSHENQENSGSISVVMRFLEYMGGKLLYPMFPSEEPEADIKDYVEKTWPLFREGSITGNCRARHVFAQKIFDIIEPLLPDLYEEPEYDVLRKMLSDIKTHDGLEHTPGAAENKPQEGRVTRRLVLDLEGNRIVTPDFSKCLEEILLSAEEGKELSVRIVLTDNTVTDYTGKDFDCARIHKSIHITETRLKPQIQYRKAYENLYTKYHLTINSYISHFERLLNSERSIREIRQYFGHSIDSSKLADHKKRYWCQNIVQPAVPDIAVLLMIDGSGSMQGRRNESARVASMVLHEVLRKHSIEHAIVEHRAIYDEPEVQHNILVDFTAKREDRYNILALSAYEGTREGLSLYWAEKYLNRKTSAENRIILMISDGEPAHGLENEACYLPPVSTKDTANAAKKIIKRGTKIIAIALDDEDDGCYEDLKQIYPIVIACTDLRRLTGQILGVISRELR